MQRNKKLMTWAAIATGGAAFIYIGGLNFFPLFVSRRTLLADLQAKAWIERIHLPRRTLPASKLAGDNLQTHLPEQMDPFDRLLQMATCEQWYRARPGGLDQFYAVAVTPGYDFPDGQAIRHRLPQVSPRLDAGRGKATGSTTPATCPPGGI